MGKEQRMPRIQTVEPDDAPEQSRELMEQGEQAEAGCAAAFVARPGMVLNTLFERPDIVGSDLREVAVGILKAES
jgi:hypothetical protein